MAPGKHSRPTSGRPKKKLCTGADLAKVLAKTQLSEENARAWLRDLKATRRLMVMKKERE